MTSAALADCHGATSDSASKIRTKRMVFMKIAPVSKEGARARSALQHQRRPKYRPLMKDLRRPVFALQQSCERPVALKCHSIGDGCVAMNAGYPPCGATIIESILRVARSGLALTKMPRSNGEAPCPLPRTLPPLKSSNP